MTGTQYLLTLTHFIPRHSRHTPASWTKLPGSISFLTMRSLHAVTTVGRYRELGNVQSQRLQVWGLGRTDLPPHPIILQINATRGAAAWWWGEVRIQLKQHGRFNSISKLTEVPHSDDASFQKLEFQVTVWGGNSLFDPAAKSAKTANVRRMWKAGFWI